MLRKLLKISQEFSAPTTQANLSSTISEIEKKQADMAYRANLQLRQQIREECSLEYEALKKELPEQIENDLRGRYELKIKDLEAVFQERLDKQEAETALLKKTLLEQSLQRLQSI